MKKNKIILLSFILLSSITGCSKMHDPISYEDNNERPKSTLVPMVEGGKAKSVAKGNTKRKGSKSKSKAKALKAKGGVQKKE